jgi:hypothetical protein
MKSKIKEANESLRRIFKLLFPDSFCSNVKHFPLNEKQKVTGSHLRDKQLKFRGSSMNNITHFGATVKAA